MIPVAISLPVRRLTRRSMLHQAAVSLMFWVGFGALACKADAQLITQSMSGTIEAGVIDTYGYFGPPGANIGGLPFGVTYTYDVQQFPSSKIGKATKSSAKIPPAIVIGVFVNGAKYILPSFSASMSFVGSIAEPSVFDSSNRSISLQYDTTGTNPTIQNPASPLISGGMLASITTQGLQNFENVVGTISSQQCSFCTGISFNGQDVSNSTFSQPVPVVVGQQIVLVAIPGNGQWITPVAGDPIGGHQPNPKSCGTDCVLPPNFSNSLASFYWYKAGTYPITYVYNSGNGGNSAYITATFFVDGPHGAFVARPVSRLNPLRAVQIVTTGGYGLPSPPYLACGQEGFACARFHASASEFPSSGRGYFEWIQILRKYTVSGVLTNQAPFQYAYSVPALDSGPAGDLPYAYYDNTSDLPATPLLICANSTMASFSASMYLLWESGLPNSIAVPLGHVNWSWKGLAVTDSSGDWVYLPSDYDLSAEAFVTDTEYPQWKFLASPPLFRCP